MSKLRMEDIIFGRSLREPGYRVDFAVGTTYSLDLETFISLPFSLGFLEEPDEVMKQSPTYIFAALRLCSDRLAVFCNFSDIKVPPKDYKVYCASEGMGRQADQTGEGGIPPPRHRDEPEPYPGREPRLRLRPDGKGREPPRLEGGSGQAQAARRFPEVPRQVRLGFQEGTCNGTCGGRPLRRALRRGRPLR